MLILCFLIHAHYLLCNVAYVHGTVFPYVYSGWYMFMFLALCAYARLWRLYCATNVDKQIR